MVTCIILEKKASLKKKDSLSEDEAALMIQKGN